MIEKCSTFGCRQYLEEKEREELKKEIADELGVDEEQVLGVYTFDEYRKIVEDRLLDEGVTEHLLYYIDVDKMIYDMEHDGTISILKYKLKNQHGDVKEVEIVAEIEW